ncbi:MAG TPA: ribonuclease III [Lachnospiraceae bacterium]|nr:ribonuclease III [Lachnospiraceae bacterium]HPF28922.1 ribonuclease III [Lachnospiraceae bacterium]
MNQEKSIEVLERVIQYKFNNRELVKEALTHSSYANERKINKYNCNERLEFLGDAVLELVSSDYIFQRYNEMPEGDMSKLRASLVCEPALAECAANIGLGDLILLGKGEDANGGRLKASVTSDAFEAVLGAMYLDGGMEPVKAFIHKHVLSDCEQKRTQSDSKSVLQEIVQAKNLGNISYEVTGEAGPEHDKVFEVQVFIDGTPYGTGNGRNKKTAEKAAAYEAVLSIRNT